MLTVLMLIVLRLCLGSHFLYEGVWKIVHRDEFTAEPFLSQAKGPMAGFFYTMIPDINGRQRLQIIKDPDGKKHINSYPITARWNEYREQAAAYLKPRDPTDQAAVAAYQRFETDAEKTFHEFVKSLKHILPKICPQSRRISPRWNALKTTPRPSRRPRFKRNTVGNG